MSTPHTAANSDARKRQAARAEVQPNGDVEALAEVLLAVDVTPAERAGMPYPAAMYQLEASSGQLARAVLASDWLAAHDKQVRREAWAEGVRDAAARIGVSPEGSLLDANPYARQEADR